jgi:hypothetical protein
MVSIAAIALGAFLELVGRQVLHELGENGLSGIHPSWSVIAATCEQYPSHPISPRQIQIDNRELFLLLVFCTSYSD